MTRCVLTAAVIYFLRERFSGESVAAKPVAALRRLQLSPDGWLHASAQSCPAVKRLTRPVCAPQEAHAGSWSGARNVRIVTTQHAECQNSLYTTLPAPVTVNPTS